LALYAKYVYISNIQLAEELFEISIDLMVTRLESDKITFDFLEGIFGGKKQTVLKLTAKKQSDYLLKAQAPVGIFE
jgi:hypothetical protein